MRYIECPAVYDGTGMSIFLAGGISNCGNWQKDMVRLLSHTDLTLVNPRRENFDITDPTASQFQIKWEHEHLNKVGAVLFWFPPETLCPITLYELGARSMSHIPIFLGIHPDYKRKFDVEIQTSLVRPDIKIVYSLEELAEQVMKHTIETVKENVVRLLKTDAKDSCAPRKYIREKLHHELNSVGINSEDAWYFINNIMRELGDPR
jgi:hypothetical protein